MDDAFQYQRSDGKVLLHKKIPVSGSFSQSPRKPSTLQMQLLTN